MTHLRSQTPLCCACRTGTRVKTASHQPTTLPAIVAFAKAASTAAAFRPGGSVMLLRCSAGLMAGRGWQRAWMAALCLEPAPSPVCAPQCKWLLTFKIKEREVRFAQKCPILMYITFSGSIFLADVLSVNRTTTVAPGPSVAASTASIEEWGASTIVFAVIAVIIVSLVLLAAHHDAERETRCMMPSYKLES